MTIAELYAERCKKPEQDADIWEHLPTLRTYAEKVRHITEFGVRTGNSTTGLLMGLSRFGGEMVSYEIEGQRYHPPKIPGVTWAWHQADTAKLESIAPTELLFIDSCHETDHVKKELRFAPLVSKYIIFHDTALDWPGGDRVRVARDAFLLANPEWILQCEWQNCNGLSVLERIK
jgi:hypothetical protein